MGNLRDSRVSLSLSFCRREIWIVQDLQELKLVVAHRGGLAGGEGRLLGSTSCCSTAKDLVRD